MADIDIMPRRAIPAMALVDSTGVASNGSSTVAQLARRGMQSICAVDGTGTSILGATLAQIARCGIQTFCPVDENGIAQDSSTADQLRKRGISPMVLLDPGGIALTGSATMETLRKRSLGYFCPLDEAGNATTMGAVILISNSTVFDNATAGTNVGVLSVAGGTGTYTFSLTNNAGGRFVTAGTNGVNLNTASAVTVGSYAVTVSATNGVTPVTRTINIAVQQAPVLPVNTVLPVISGIATVGQTLTTTDGTWTGFPTPTFTYQWKRGGTNIAGATTSNYLLVTADLAATITVTVTATNTAGNASATSLPTAAVTRTTLSYTPITSATNGTPYTGATPSTSGGKAPYVYSISAGTLPAGTSLNTSTGVISGTPTVTAAYASIVLTVTDANGIADASAPFTITVAAAGGMTLMWTSANTVYDPVFTLTFYGAVVGDILTLQIDDNSDFSSLYTSAANTLDSAEIAAGTITYSGITTLLPGVTYYARVQLNRSSAISYSNTVNQTMFIDTTAPTLTLALGAQLATTTASLGVTTNEANGTLYYVVTTSATAPTAAQVKAGQNNSGTAALYAGSQAISSTGAKTATATGITAGARYAYYMHEDAAANQSAVSASALWTQTAGSGATWVPNATAIVHDEAGVSYTTSFNLTQTTAATDTTIVIFSQDLRTTTGVTINGSAMTLAVQANAGDGQNISIWYKVGAYTNPTVVATAGVQYGKVGCSYGKWTGASAVPSATTVALAPNFRPVPTIFPSLTVPTGGVLIAGHLIAFSIATTWDNITKDTDISGATYTHSTAHYSVAGAIAVSVSSPGGDYAGDAEVAITIGP